MKVDTMRRIDYYVGVPLCFLGSICQKAAALINRRDRKTPKNVLFIELSEMGSAILVDPAMRKLQKKRAPAFTLLFSKKINPVWICWAQFPRKIFIQSVRTTFCHWRWTV